MDGSFSHCPDIIATYLEVINITWAIQTANKLPLSSFVISTPKHIGSALFKIEKAIHDVHVLSQASDPMVQLRSLLLSSQDIGLDGLVAALETASRIYSPKTCDPDVLSSLCVLYVDTCLDTDYSAAQVLAIENLTDAMDELLAQRRIDGDDILQQALVRLWTRLPSRTMNPALSHAIIRVSGCIAATLSNNKCHTRPIDLHAWGVMMADAILDDKVRLLMFYLTRPLLCLQHQDLGKALANSLRSQTLDTRLAASLSLRSFFAAHAPLLPQDRYLTALVALYDALNDDDDQVRDIAAGAAKILLHSHALVPLEAANRLLHFLTEHFGQSPLFHSIVADRLVGHYGTCAATTSQIRSPHTWEPAKVQLDRVMRFDDSLFAVEEQNLFVDEVRETKRWVDVAERLEWGHTRMDEDTDKQHVGNQHPALVDKLVEWVQDGLVHLATLAHVNKDGPLGWASDPAVFAICTRLVRVSVALSMSSATRTPDLERALSVAKDALTVGEGRVSMLLAEPWS